MNPHLLRKFRQRRDVLGIIDIIRNGRFIGDFTRATTRTYFDSTGTLQTAAINTLPWEYDPVTLLPLGYSFWEGRTNSLRNNTMVGASAGTPGTVPTNWAVSLSGGIAQTIVGTGTESGVTYIDFRFSGTTSDTSPTTIAFETTTGVAGLTAQNWSVSSFLRLVAGSFTNISSTKLRISERAAGAFVKNNDGSALTITSAGLATQSNAYSVLTSGGGTVDSVWPLVVLATAGSGVAIDITLRIGMPQLELGASATPVIATSGSAVARSADVASISGSAFTSIFNTTALTYFGSFMIPAALASGAAPRVICISDGVSEGTNGDLVFVSQAAGGACAGNTFSASANPGRIDAGSAFAAGVKTKFAYAVAASDRALSVNGSAVVASAAGARPIGADRAFIGQGIAASNCLNGWIDDLGVIAGRQANYILQGRAQ